MYRDVDLHALKAKQLSKAKDALEQRIKKYAGRIPETVSNFEEWSHSFLPYFTVKKKGRVHFEYEFNDRTFQEACSLCGKVTLFISSDRLGRDSEIMQYYRSKETVEDCFDTTKNGLSDKRLHVHGDPQVDGKLFVMLISLILRRTIHSRLKDYLHQHDMTDEDTLRSLEKVIFYRKEGYWRLKDAISKQQREIMTELRFDLGGRLGSRRCNFG